MENICVRISNGNIDWQSVIMVANNEAKTLFSINTDISIAMYLFQIFQIVNKNFFRNLPLSTFEII